MRNPRTKKHVTLRPGKIEVGYPGRPWTYNSIGRGDVQGREGVRLWLIIMTGVSPLVLDSLIRHMRPV